MDMLLTLFAVIIAVILLISLSKFVFDLVRLLKMKNITNHITKVSFLSAAFLVSAILEELKNIFSVEDYAEFIARCIAILIYSLVVALNIKFLKERRENG